MAVIDCLNYVSNLPPFTLLQSWEAKQGVMFGLEKSGKTTLLYRLKCPLWKQDQLMKDIKYIKDAKKDPAYHYEELPPIDRWRYGIWDVPAKEVELNLCNLFYKYLRISLVFFVVDVKQESLDNIERMERCRRLLDFLSNEDELRRAVFIIVYNIFDAPVGVDKAQDEAFTLSPDELLDATREFLGIEELKSQQDFKERFAECKLNVTHGLNASQKMETHVWTVSETEGEGWSTTSSWRDLMQSVRIMCEDIDEKP